MSLRIRLYGDPILRKKGEPVTVFDDALRAWIEEIKVTIREEDAAALAAQQVGRALNLTVVDFTYMLDRGYDIDFDYELDGKKPPLQLMMPLVIINPKFETLSADKDLMEEYCMSLPGGIGPVVERSKSLTVSFQDEKGDTHLLKCNGILARCIQHECDHLEGVLITDYATPVELRKFEAKLKKLKRLTRDILKEEGKGKQ